LIRFAGVTLSAVEEGSSPQAKSRAKPTDLEMAEASGGRTHQRRIARRSPGWKITQCVLTRYENSLLYLILQPLTRTEFLSALIESPRSEHGTITLLSHQLAGTIATDSLESRCANSNFPPSRLLASVVESLF